MKLLIDLLRLFILFSAIYITKEYNCNIKLTKTTNEESYNGCALEISNDNRSTSCDVGYYAVYETDFGFKVNDESNKLKGTKGVLVKYNGDDVCSIINKRGIFRSTTDGKSFTYFLNNGNDVSLLVEKSCTEVGAIVNYNGKFCIDGTDENAIEFDKNKSFIIKDINNIYRDDGNGKVVVNSNKNSIVEVPFENNHTDFPNGKLNLCSDENECEKLKDKEKKSIIHNISNDITVVLPYNENYDIDDFYKTVESLENFNINYIIISKTPLNRKNVYVYNFENIWQALNYGIKQVKTNYITFILPGDYILENTYNINSNADIIQLQHIRTNENGQWKKKNNDVGVYDIYNEIPKYLNMLCDKIYKKDLVINNNINFKKNDLYSPLIFCLHYMEKSHFIEVVENEIVHKVNSNKDIHDLSEQELSLSNSFLSYLRNVETENECLMDYIKAIKEKQKEIVFYNHIDFVLPYVTTEDPLWQEQYKKYKYLSNSDYASGIERFRDNGMLKYTLRSIAKHLPWIKQLHIIVSSESQIPSWVNRTTVNFIFHKDYIPKKQLPTFNSSTIEMYLSELPGINNAFIYGNDDTICFKDLPPTFFFDGGKPKYSQFIRNYNPEAPGDMLRRQAFNLVLGRNDTNRVTGTQHIPQGLKLTWIKECFEKFRTEMEESCTRFREDKNYNQYVFTFYQMIEKSIINEPKNAKSYIINENRFEYIMEDDFSQYDFACFNDSFDSTQEQWDAIMKKINDYFPEKCKYEI